MTFINTLTEFKYIMDDNNQNCLACTLKYDDKWIIHGKKCITILHKRHKIVFQVGFCLSY